MTAAMVRDPAQVPILVATEKAWPVLVLVGAGGFYAGKKFGEMGRRGWVGVVATAAVLYLAYRWGHKKAELDASREPASVAPQPQPQPAAPPPQPTQPQQDPYSSLLRGYERE